MSHVPTPPLVVFQVLTRRTSSCPPALLCPAGVAPATVQPVRSRSSAAQAVSRGPALRRLSDELENSTLPTPPTSSTSSAPHLQPVRPHAALHFLYFLLVHACHFGRRTSVFVLCIEEEYYLRKSAWWRSSFGYSSNLEVHISAPLYSWTVLSGTEGCHTRNYRKSRWE